MLQRRETFSDRPPAWVDPVMRFGYAARGLVYVLIGALAFVVSVDGGSTPDSKAAAGTLLKVPFHNRTASRWSHSACRPMHFGASSMRA